MQSATSTCGFVVLVQQSDVHKPCTENSTISINIRRLCSCIVPSVFFLQSAVTQSRILDLTTIVNMTWKAPMHGFQNVAFWYGTMHGCSCASLS